MGEAAVTVGEEAADTDSVAVDSVADMALVEEAADTDSVAAGSVADMALEGEVVGVALSDSPDVSTAAALVRQSMGRVDFRLEVLLVGEITAASVTGASVDAIETFTIVGFAILMGTFSISAPPAMNIQIIPIITHIPTTTTMGI